MADARRFKALSMVPPLADEVARQIEDAAGSGEGTREIAEQALLTADQAIIDAATAQDRADEAYDLGSFLQTAFGGEITRLDGEVDAAQATADAAQANFASRDALVTAVAGGFDRPGGHMVSADGIEYLKMPSSHPQFGSNPIPDLPGWITHTSVTDEAAVANWGVSTWFGGPWKALETIETTSADAFAGSRTSVGVSRIVSGSGENGPSRADSALHVVVGKSDIYGANPGEIDALRVNTFQDGHSDSSGILVNSQKKIGDGAITEGSALGLETSTRRFTTDFTVPVSNIQSIIGYSPNPMGEWNGRDSIGFYSDNRVGAGFANFLGIADSTGVGAASMTYLIAGFEDRSTDRKFFSAAPGGTVEITSYDGTANVGPSVIRDRASASPLNNDNLSEDQYLGRNSAAETVTYARTQAGIKEVTDGAEIGRYTVYANVGGSLVRQAEFSNGVVFGTGGTLGTGTLNISGAFFVKGAAAVDGSGGMRFPPYGTANIADAAHAVNTTDKAAGKAIFDTANGRVLVASGPAATDPWNLMDGTVAVTPA